MGRLIFLVLLIIMGNFLHSTGVLESLNNGNKALISKVCEIASAKENFVYVSADKQMATVVIDAEIGAGYLRAPAVRDRTKSLEEGTTIKVINHTQVKILSNDRIMLYGVPHQLVKIQLMSGPNKGGRGWVERNDVLDTPIHAILQNTFRAKKLNAD